MGCSWVVLININSVRLHYGLVDGLQLNEIGTDCSKYHTVIRVINDRSIVYDMVYGSDDLTAVRL